MSTDKRLAISFAFASLLVGSLSACSNSENPQALISEAKAYQKKGEPKAAIIQLKNALQKSPDDVEARQILGVIYHESGDPQSAEKELRKALSLGADPASVLPTLGKVLLLQGQYQKILDEVTQPEGKKADARLLAVRGSAYLALGKRKEARESFELSLKENPDSADALIGLAKQLIVEGSIDGATKLAEQAVVKNPTDLETWLFKGDLLRAEGKPEDALAAYAKVNQLKPDNISARVASTHIHINAGKFDVAKAELDAARKHDPKSLLVTYSQALLEFSQGKHAAALESVQQVLRVAPEHLPSVLLAGATQYALGATQQAEQHLKRYLEGVPGHPYASKLLVAILLKNGDATRAIKTLNPLLKEGGQDPQLLSLAGEAYMQAKEFSKATEYLEKASLVAPEMAIIRTALGMSKLAQGENARGIAELELATNLDPKTTQAGILLVMTHIRLNEYDRALAVIEKLEKAHSDNPLLANLKGGVYLSKKDVPAARSSFQKALALQPAYFPAVANLAQIDVIEKRPDAAKKRLESFLAVDKKSANAMMALASLELAQGRKAEATTWLERAHNENPDELKPAKVLATHYLKVGERQKGFALAQKLNTTNPGDGEILDLLAQAQFASNDLAGALQSYKKLAALAPTSALVQFRIASVLAEMQNPNASADALKAALALKPDYLEAQLAMAALEVRRGNHEHALKTARLIQKQQPKKPFGHVLEGDILMSQNKSEPALKAYEQAYAISKNSLMVTKLYQALKQSGKDAEGQARLTQWLKEHPSDVAVRTQLANAHFMNRQVKGAIEQYQTVLQSDPKNITALNNLAVIYQEGRNSQALDYAEKAYAQMPENAAILDTLGWILVEQGNVARGVPLLHKAASKAPAASEIRYHLALGLMKQGDKEKARKELEQLLGADKAFAKAEDAKALLNQLQ